jgi:hypothetical protein
VRADIGVACLDGMFGHAPEIGIRWAAKPLTNALISAGVRIIGGGRRCPRADSGYRLRNSSITTANDGLAMML